MRHTINHLARVLYERYRPVFLANDDVGEAVFRPVEGNGRYHTKPHRYELITKTQLLASCILWVLARADIFEVGERINKLAADNIQITVAIEISE